MKLTHKKSSTGQAIVEFALVLTVLLMIIFIVVEAGRLLWGWVTVQNAARVGARYAVTGEFEPNCPLEDHAKFGYLCDGDQTTIRVASITDAARGGMSGLPLDEDSGIYEDDYYYNIQVLGVDDSGEFKDDHGGLPNSPVVVRVTYRVPIITPLLRPIVASVPIFGQVTMNNEAFGSLGGNNQAQGVPPPLPDLPTPGVTPSPTFTPSPTPSTTPIPTETPVTPTTPTATATDVPCRVRFTESVVEGQNYFFINGEPGSVVTVINATTGVTIIDNLTLTFIPDDGRVCDGFDAPELTQAQIDLFSAGDVLSLSSNDGSANSTIVLAAPPTATPSPTMTPSQTPLATSTFTPTPTNTPSVPYIRLLPNCGAGPNAQINVIGVNWPDNRDIRLLWDGNPQSTISSGHGGSFSQTWTQQVSTGDYTVRAETVQGNGNVNYEATFKVPCDDATPVPTVTPTGTPAPADMIVVGPPQMISTRPIQAYEPVTFQITISNTGEVDVNSQFFVDLYFDPAITVTNETEVIPVADSVGYMAVSSLGGGASRDLVITTQLGFENLPEEHVVYGMVDSIRQVNEEIETNNISTPLAVDYVTPAFTPTPTITPDPNGTDIIAGVVRTLNVDWVPQRRAQITLWLGTQRLKTTITDAFGYYQFSSVLPNETYRVTACVNVDNSTQSGSRTDVSPPNQYTDIFLLEGACQ